MKNLIIVALLMFSLTSFAQEKRGMNSDKKNLTSEQKVDMHIKKLTADLTLNEKQIKEIRALAEKEGLKREESRKEMTKLREKKKEERKEIVEKKRAEMQEQQAKFSVEMKKILSPEQYTKWEKMKEDRKEVRGKNRKEKMMNKKEKRQNKI